MRRAPTDPAMIMWLTASNLVEALKREKGAVLSILDKQGRSLLHWAILTNNLEVAYLLIKAGISLDIRDRRGRAPLHYARSQEAIDALIAAGANANPATATSRTPLHAYVRSGRMDLVRALLRRGGDVHMRDASGRAALHHAAMAGQVDQIRSLVEEEGVAIEPRDKHGRFPLYYALSGNHFEAACALMDLGADLARIDIAGTAWQSVASLDDMLRLDAYQHELHMKAIVAPWSPHQECEQLHVSLLQQMGGGQRMSPVASRMRL